MRHQARERNSFHTPFQAVARLAMKIVLIQTTFTQFWYRWVYQMQECSCQTQASMEVEMLMWTNENTNRKAQEA